MTNSSNDDDDDKVGYRRPPKSTRFKPGRSGCPSGGHRKRKLNQLERKEKDDKKLKDKEKSLADDLKRIALKEYSVRVDGELKNLSAHQIIMMQMVRRAMKDDAEDKHVRQYLSAVAKIGLLDKASTDPGPGVLVIYSPMQLEEWAKATEGKLLPEDPLHGIPGAEGLLDTPGKQRGRTPPDDDLE